MPISTSCSCGRKLNLKEELAGKTVKCPQCGSALKVPDGRSTSTAVATPPPRSAPADSRIMPKPAAAPPPRPKKEEKAGPKVVMGNFKSLDDFDETGNVKKKAKVYTKEEEASSEVGEGGGTTGGAMAQIAAEALSAEKEKPKLRCPGCGRGVKPEDVICTKCGTNIKTGRRLGESAISLGPRMALTILVVLLISGAGGLYRYMQKPPPPPGQPQKEMIDAQKLEITDTLAKLEAIVNDGDPDISRSLPYIANMGNEALPLISEIVTSGAPMSRRKAVKLLEIMAFNGFRSWGSVTALGSLVKERDTTIRDSAAEALQWSAMDLTPGAAYWAATVDDPGKVTDANAMYALPYDDCRQQLETAGVKVAKDMDPKTKKIYLKNPGNRPGKAPVIPLAGLMLQRFWDNEMQSLKLTRLIQAIRARRFHLIQKLIMYLEPENPKMELGFAPTAADRGRAFRCLSAATGRQTRRWDDWVSWWQNTGAKKYPTPKPAEDAKMEVNPDAPPAETPK